MPKQQRAEFEDERRWPVETIPVEEIESDSRVCPRERIDPSVVAEYSERMQEGDLFPPLTVFCINQKYLLASGSFGLKQRSLPGQKRSVARCAKVVCGMPFCFLPDAIHGTDTAGHGATSGRLLAYFSVMPSGANGRIARSHGDAVSVRPLLPSFAANSL